MAKYFAPGDEWLMRTLILNRLVAGLVVVCCLTAVSTRAEVRDSAGLFSATAVKQADETIRNIQRDFRKNVLVETFAGVPESRTNEYALNREQFFANMVRERAQAARLDGVYVLVMKEQPPHRLRVQVGMGEATRQRAFVPANRDALVRMLQTSFRENKYDEGLRSAVAYVGESMRSNLGGPVTSSTGAKPAVQDPARQTPATASSPKLSAGSMFFVGALIVGGIVVAIFLIRLIAGAMGGGSSRGAGGGLGRVGGGGGFMTGLLGGLGGAIAGSWLYDRLTGNAHASDNVPPTHGNSDAGGDFSSSGGDVGDFGSSGGDVGGGDFGGGGD